MTLIGAAQMDWEAGRSLIAGKPPPKNGFEKAAQLTEIYTSPARLAPDTSTAHASRLLSNRQFGNASDFYSTTSIIANKQRAALGNKVRKFFQKHPSLLARSQASKKSRSGESPYWAYHRSGWRRTRQDAP